MKQRFIKPLLIIACLLCSITASAYNFEADGIYYNKLSDGKSVAVTSGDKAYTGEIDIHAQVLTDGKTYNVTEIDGGAFADCPNLTNILISSSVTSIGSKAFAGCTGLTSISIPTSVTSIGEYTFYNCTSLESVSIPEGVISLGESAFIACSGLKNVTIPSSVTSIGNNAFAYCSSLKEIYNYSLTPQTINANVFGSVTTSDIALYVPFGASEAYATAPVWKDFNGGVIKEFKDVTITSEAMPYASLYSPVALTKPEGLKAYTGKDNETTVSLNEYATDGVIAKLTGVVLTGAAGTYRFIQADGDGTTVTGNCFEGTLTEVDTPANSYVLGFEDNTPGFYKFTGEKIAAYKVYIPGTTAGGAKTFSFGTTGITEVNNDKADNVYYNLDGTRATTLKSGHIYITNSKKVLIK